MRALGAKEPTFAHLPMILGQVGQRLSKRHGAVSVLQFEHDGYLPDALLNYLVRLGWSHGDQEIFSRKEMVRLFKLDDVNRAPASFDTEKLNWLNQHYLKSAPVETLAAALGEQLATASIDTSVGPRLEAVVELHRERAQTLKEMAEQTAFYFAEPAGYDEQAAKKHLRPVAAEPLARLRDTLGAVSDWRAETVQAALDETLAALHLKLPKLAIPLRVALAGKAATPSIDATLALVGKDRTLARIDRALVFIQNRANAA
jgi:glutamyl-tRNA synthetase